MRPTQERWRRTNSSIIESRCSALASNKSSPGISAISRRPPSNPNTRGTPGSRAIAWISAASCPKKRGTTFSQVFRSAIGMRHRLERFQVLICRGDPA
jgi:hypothetical protein